MSEQKFKALYSPDGKVSIVPENVNFKDSLIPGFYKIVETNTGMGTSYDMSVDESVNIPHGAIKLAKEHIDLGYINQYFSDVSKDLHKKLNLKMKMGYLLHGIQGTGKTTSQYAIAELLIKQAGAIVVTVYDINGYKMSLDFLERCKRDFGDFLSITIFDECETDMYRYEGHFKRFLDSTYSLDNHISFFSTNKIEDIPVAIKERPSRIKFCTEITGIKDESIIFEVISRMNNPLEEDVRLLDKDLKNLVPEMKGKTLDEIKNTFIDSVFDYNYSKKVLKKEPAALLAEQVS